MKTFNETYQGGFPGIRGNQPVKINFKDGEVEFDFYTMNIAPIQSFSFSLRGNFESKKVILNTKDIIEVGLDQETYRSAGKAAVGAIVGGVLTGGIGLLAGAALGGKRRKENFLNLEVFYNNEYYQILIKPNKNIPQLYSAFRVLIK